MRNTTVFPCSDGYPGEYWLRAETLEQILKRFTSCLFCEQQVWLLGANTGLCPPALGFVQIPALVNPCVATAGLSFKITVESSLVPLSWGSACSDYPCNPCNVRFASRPWEKIWACDLFILISLLIDSSLPKHPPAGNFEPDFLLFISATLNDWTSEGISAQQSM